MVVVNRKSDWIAFAWFCIVSLLVGTVFATKTIRAQQTAKSVFVNWDATSSAGDVAGVYNVWRAPLLADGTCGAPVTIATVSGLVYRDTNIVPGAVYCYQTSFADVDGGESALSDPQVADTNFVLGPISPVLQIDIK